MYMTRAEKYYVALNICMVFLLGMTLTYAYYRDAAAAKAMETVQSLKDSSRTAWGKYYDLEEQWQDRLDSALSDASMRQWKAESDLAACLKGKE